MIQVSINEKIGLEVNQPPVPFHRDDYICINCNGEVEHIYKFANVRKNSGRIKFFRLNYPNFKNLPLDEIEFIASKLPIFEKYVYPKSGLIEFQTKIANKMIAPSIIIFCGYIFYLAFLDSEYSMDPTLRLTLLGIEKYEK